MIPTADFYGKIIDCRQLVLKADFFLLSEEGLFDLIREYYHFVNSQFDEKCILAWIGNDKVIKKKGGLESFTLDKYNTFYIDLLGDVKSSTVFNKTTQKAYSKKMEYELMWLVDRTPFCSVDYPAYREEKLDPYRGDPRLFYEALWELFSLDDRIERDAYDRHDIEGGIVGGQMSEAEGAPEKGLFSGELRLTISRHSLGDELDEMADKLYDWAKKLADTHTNVNAQILLRGLYRGYSHYFHSVKDALVTQYAHRTGIPRSFITPSRYPEVFKNAHRMEMRSKFMYLHDLGWANVVSPTVKKLLGAGRIGEATETFQREALPSGVFCTRLLKRISDTTLNDLRAVKEEIYPVLHPGEARLKPDSPYFRSTWEQVPLVEGELEVERGIVIFKHLVEIDENYLLGEI